MQIFHFFSVRQSVLNQRHLPWNESREICQVESSSELSQLTQQTKSYLMNVAQRNVTQSYWLGLTREVNANESGCIETSVGNGTHVTDYRLNRCLVAACSNFTRTRYSRCDNARHPMCIKNVEIVEDEEEGVVVKTNITLKFQSAENRVGRILAGALKNANTSNPFIFKLTVCYFIAKIRKLREAFF